MPHFKAIDMINLQYEIGICHTIHNKGTMSQWQLQVTIFLNGTDVIILLLSEMASDTNRTKVDNNTQNSLPKDH